MCKYFYSPYIILRTLRKFSFSLLFSLPYRNVWFSKEAVEALKWRAELMNFVTVVPPRIETLIGMLFHSS